MVKRQSRLNEKNLRNNSKLEKKRKLLVKLKYLYGNGVPNTTALSMKTPQNLNIVNYLICYL